MGSAARGTGDMGKFMNDGCRDHPMVCVVQTPGRDTNVFIVAMGRAIETIGQRGGEINENAVVAPKITKCFTFWQTLKIFITWLL